MTCTAESELLTSHECQSFWFHSSAHECVSNVLVLASSNTIIISCSVNVLTRATEESQGDNALAVAQVTDSEFRGDRGNGGQGLGVPAE